jgi:hypothetical protein
VECDIARMTECTNGMSSPMAWRVEQGVDQAAAARTAPGTLTR